MNNENNQNKDNPHFWIIGELLDQEKNSFLPLCL